MVGFDASDRRQGWPRLRHLQHSACELINQFILHETAASALPAQDCLAPVHSC